MESAASNFSLWNIFPHFSTLFGGGQAGETLTAWFVLIILTILAIFSYRSWVWYRKANRRVEFFRTLISEVEQTSLAEKRRSMAQSALTESSALGKLWKEFDESLVESKEMPYLRNTLDANHFFSTHTLAGELTENRLLAAVPGFLTAVGVIGTFIGLSVGLAGLQFESAGVDQLKSGIFEMVAGASVAFVTSVWGVFSSLLFNFGEKYLERRIRHDIFWLQNQIDFLYPRITAEQSLVTIADTGKNTDLAIQGLAEKLGDKLQEAVESISSEMLTGIEAALRDIMDPAIKSLVNNANNGANAALDSLVGNFMEKMGEAGEEQRKAMEQASEKMTNAADGMGDQLKGFSEELQSQTATLSDTFTSNLSALEERDEKRAEAFDSAIVKIGDLSKGMADQFQEASQKQQQSFDRIFEKLELLEPKLADVAVKTSDAAHSLQEASVRMNTSSSHIDAMTTKLSESSVALEECIDESVDLIKESKGRFVSIIEQTKGITENLTSLTKQMRETVEILDEASEAATEGLSDLDKRLEGFTQSLRAQLSELQSQAASLMSEIAKQVEDQTISRMNVWNEQTQKFTSQMTGAVSAFAGVIDDLEGKIGA